MTRITITVLICITIFSQFSFAQMEVGDISSHKLFTEGLENFSGDLHDESLFGIGITELSDMDNDGIKELAVTSIEDKGGIWILYLNENLTVKRHKKITIDSIGGTLNTNNAFGIAIENIGDLDHNGTDDIAVGDWKDQTQGGNAGAVWILFLNDDAEVVDYNKIDGINDNLQHLSALNLFGSSLSYLGDINNDSYPELAVGTSGYNSEYGSVWILSLNTNGNIQSQTIIDNSITSQKGFPLQDNDKFGSHVSNIGDINNNGTPDLAVQAIYDSEYTDSAGAVYILYLSENLSVDSITKLGGNSQNFQGVLNPTDFFGRGIEAIGDIDNDGNIDLAIGAAGNDYITFNNSGAIYIIFLTETGKIKEYKKITKAQLPSLHNGDALGACSIQLLNSHTNPINTVIAVSAIGTDSAGINTGGFYTINILNSNPQNYFISGSIYSGELIYNDIIVDLFIDNSSEPILTNTVNDGVFYFDNLPTAEYRLKARPINTNYYLYHEAEYPASIYLSNNASDIRINLQSKTYNISGNIYADSEPLEEGQAVLFDTDNNIRFTTNIIEGEFLFTEVPYGTYSLDATPAHLYSDLYSTTRFPIPVIIQSYITGIVIDLEKNNTLISSTIKDNLFISITDNFISIENSNNIEKVSLHNICGEYIHIPIDQEDDKITLYSHSLPTGIYFLRILHSNGDIATHRFAIQ